MASATVSHINVLKLPNEGPVPAAPAAVSASLFALRDAVNPPDRATLYKTEDSSSVIFCPASVRDGAPFPASIRGDEPPSPVALAEAQESHSHFIPAKSNDFADFFAASAA